jgi:hypothetical protein
MMDANRPKLSSKIAKLISLVALLVLAVSCGGTITEPTEPPLETSVPPVTTEEPDEPATSMPEPTRPPEQPAADLGAGPWWFVVANDGLWAANLDGSGLARLVAKEQSYAAWEQRAVIAPQGGHVAFVTLDNPERFWHGMTLHVLTLPSGEVQTITPLIADEYMADPDSSPGDPAFEAARAIAELPNLAWSPDGQMLAFMGVIEGPTSDLYVYSLADGSITRLTDGPSHGIRPTWSPDGIYVVHAGVSGLGTGAGFGVQGVWAARADDSGVRSIYDLPAMTGDEVTVGWDSPTGVIVYTWSVICGPSNLRVVDVESGEVTTLWAEFFDEVVVSGSGNGALVTVPDFISDCNTDGQVGLFLTHPDLAAPLRVADVGTRRAVWSPGAGVFFAEGEFGVISVSRTGAVNQIDGPLNVVPVLSPAGRVWAFASSSGVTEEGIWMGPYGQAAEQVFWGDARLLALGPNGDSYSFFGGPGFYVGSGSEAVLLDADMAPGYEGGVFLLWP